MICPLANGPRGVTSTRVECGNRTRSRGVVMPQPRSLGLARRRLASAVVGVLATLTLVPVPADAAPSWSECPCDVGTSGARCTTVPVPLDYRQARRTDDRDPRLAGTGHRQREAARRPGHQLRRAGRAPVRHGRSGRPAARRAARPVRHRQLRPARLRAQRAGQLRPPPGPAVPHPVAAARWRTVAAMVKDGAGRPSSSRAISSAACERRPH